MWLKRSFIDLAPHYRREEKVREGASHKTIPCYFTVMRCSTTALLQFALLEMCGSQPYLTYMGFLYMALIMMMVLLQGSLLVQLHLQTNR